MKLTFLGATGTVTGSKYLIEEDNKKILIDCGLFQGYKELRLRNWDPFCIDPANINYVILTHAHIDHSGYIPLLVKNGFRGKIFASEATLELCKILLPDSGFLHEEDARRSNKYGYSKHKPALPLYTEEDAYSSLKYFHVVDFGKAIHLTDNIYFTLSRSGHILGSAFVILSNGRTKVTFSGDLGRKQDPIMKSPAKIEETDYLLIESTYGDRAHDPLDPMSQIAKIIKTTAAKGGTVVIPAFAVGRTQSILYYIYELKRRGRIPDLPIFYDSPMASSATAIMQKFKNEHKLPVDLCEKVCNIAQYVRTREESKQLDNFAMPKVIISASGMATGGRVLHHLKTYLGHPKNTILFAGFQAGGTRGDRLLKGERLIKIHGEMHKVRAKIKNLHNISAHADADEIIEWLSNFRKQPQKTYITHGEIEASTALKAKIETELGWQNVVVPEYLQQEAL